MKRRAFLIGLVAGAAVAGPALAQGVVDDVVAQLRRQGFRSITTERTLLGRVRIVATRSDGSREIIINPRTGEILRDFWTARSGGKGKVEIIEDRSGSDGSDGSGGSDGSDDDDDDGEGSSDSGGGGGDDDDDDDDDG